MPRHGQLGLGVGSRPVGIRPRHRRSWPKLWRLPTLLAAVTGLAILATACGTSDKAAESPETVAPSTGEPFAQSRLQLTREITVGVVTDANGLNDQGFNTAAFQGLQRAIFDFEVEGKVLESLSVADYVPNLTEFAGAGYDLVISIGPSMADATRRVAQQHPETEFAIVDFDYPVDERLPNVQGIIFNESEAGYVVGYLAALTTETGTIAGIGSAAAAPVNMYFAGFDRGATAADPMVEVLRLDAADGSAPHECQGLVEAAIASNADVVFPLRAECGPSALDAARDGGVWGIGVDVDHAFLGDHILTSAVKRVDVAVWDTVQAAISGIIEDALGTMSPYRLKGGDVVLYGWSYEGVGIGPVSPALSPSLLAQVDDVVESIIEGALKIPRS